MLHRVGIMDVPIELNGFTLKRLSIEWKEGKSNDEQKSSLSFSFDLKTRNDDGRQMLVTLGVTGKPLEEHEGLDFAVDIIGSFTIKDVKRDLYLHLINSANILYGILRGQMALYTSSFRKGGIILPTVMMEKEIAEYSARISSNNTNK